MKMNNDNENTYKKGDVVEANYTISVYIEAEEWRTGNALATLEFISPRRAKVLDISEINNEEVTRYMSLTGARRQSFNGIYAANKEIGKTKNISSLYIIGKIEKEAVNTHSAANDEQTSSNVFTIDNQPIQGLSESVKKNLLQIRGEIDKHHKHTPETKKSLRSVAKDSGHSVNKLNKILQNIPASAIANDEHVAQAPAKITMADVLSGNASQAALKAQQEQQAEQGNRFFSRGTDEAKSMAH